MKLVFIVGLVLATFCGLSKAADGVAGCYYCTGAEECRDEEKFTRKECMDIEKYPDIKFVCITLFTEGEVTKKSCWLDKAVPDGACNENLTTSVCVCEEDYCNASTNIQSIWWLIVPSFVLLLLIGCAFDQQHQ